MVNDGSGDSVAADDSVREFIEDLRRLRAEHDNPTWSAMSSRARRRGVQVSHGTLHNAVASGRLPSHLAVNGFVTALSTDPAVMERWQARRAALAEVAGARPTGVPPALPVRTSPPRRRWWFAAVVGLLVASNVATGFIVHAVGRPPAAPAAAVPAVTGDDPARTVCVQDAEIAAGSAKNPAFLIEVLFSVRCQAGWARITRYDDAAFGNTVVISIYRRSDPAGASRQDATEPDVQSAYTTLIVRADPTDRLCATGTITSGTEVAPMSEPICT